MVDLRLLMVDLRLLMVDLWVVSVSNLLNNSIESWFVISVILNYAFRAISFVQSVFAFHDIPVAHLPLAFVVTSVFVLNAILVFVFWIRMVILVVVGSVTWVNWTPAVLNWRSRSIYNRLRNQQWFFVMVIVFQVAVVSANIACGWMCVCDGNDGKRKNNLKDKKKTILKFLNPILMTYLLERSSFWDVCCSTGVEMLTDAKCQICRWYLYRYIN